MKKLLLFLFFVSICFAKVQAQFIPAIQWQKSLGGTSDDRATAIEQTTDGGYIIAGFANSNDGDVTGNHGDNDYWIVKLDPSGSLTWQVSLGGTGDDEAQSVQQTTDHGFIVAGYSNSNDGNVTGNHGDYDYWIVKLDSSGSLTWQLSLGGTGDDEARSVQLTGDGGYVIAGYAGSNDGDVSGNHGWEDFWVVKLNSSGTITWQKALGGSEDDYAYSIQETAGGGFIVAGAAFSNNGDVSVNHGQQDCWIVKLDETGSLVWQKSFGGSISDEAMSIQQTDDGGYVVASRSNSNDGDVSGNHGDDDYWILKLDSAGSLLWKKCFGGSNYDDPYSILQTTEGEFMIAGYTMSNDGDIAGNHGSADYWLIKLDSGGNLVAQESLGGTAGDIANMIRQIPGGFIVAGLTYSNNGDVSGNHGVFTPDYWIVKLSCNPQFYYDDADGDGYGIATDSILSCTMPAGYSANHLDCMDSSSTAHPGALEIFGNGIDDNCNGLIDESETLIPDIEWGNSFGGSAEDRASDIRQTTDGGFILAGFTLSNDDDVSGNHGGYDYWIVKLNSTDSIIWQKCLGGSGDDQANSIEQTTDHGFIIAGYSASNDGNVTGNHGNEDYWIVKLDSLGNIAWQKSLGGSADDAANSIRQTNDGGYVVAGYSKSNNGDVSGNHGDADYWIVKLDATGAIVWQKCLGGTTTDEAFSIQKTIDHGFIVSGDSYSIDGDVSGNHLNGDEWTVKLDSSGNLLWQKCLGGTYTDGAFSIQQTSDGGFLSAGYTSSNDYDVSGNHGYTDVWIDKLNASGNLVWQKCLGGQSSDFAYSLQPTPDGGFILVGRTDSNDGDVSGFHGLGDYWVVKIDTFGNLIWQKCLGGTLDEWGKSAIPTNDGGFVIAGYSNSTDGEVSGNHGDYDCWIVKLSCNPQFFYVDADGDGYGTSVDSIFACSVPVGYSLNNLDCDDTNPGTHPGTCVEIPGNGIDDDCDGVIDEVLPNPSIAWQKCFGGSASEEARSIQQTMDKGFIVAGSSDSNDGDVTGNNGLPWPDYWIVKLDSLYNLVWQKSLGGSSDDWARSIQQTADSGYIAAGFVYSNDGDVSGNHGSFDFWIVKLDASGTIVWQNALGGSNSDRAFSAQQTTDGGFIIAGDSYSNDGDVSGNHGNFDFWIVKLDASGNMMWQKTLGGSTFESAESIQQTADGGFIIAGNSASSDGDVSGNHGVNDFWIVKLNQAGNLVWQKSFGGSSVDVAHSIKQTFDGGFIVAGESLSIDGDVSGNHGGGDCWIVRLDSLGGLVWQKTLGGSSQDIAYSVVQTTDSAFLVAATTYSNDGDVLQNHGAYDYWIVRLDPLGNITWQESLGGCSLDIPSSILQTSDGRIVVAGYSSSQNDDVSGNHSASDDYWIVQLSSQYSCTSDFTLSADSLTPHHYWAVNLATGISPLSYFWSWGDGTFDSVPYPNHTYAAAGFYTICLTIHDSAGCESNFCNSYTLQKMSAAEQENTIIYVDVVDNIPTTIQNANDKQTFWLFPNPASNFITAQLLSPGTTPFNAVITITNLLGETVFEKTSTGIVGNLNEEIYLDKNFVQGMYFVKVSSGQQQWVKPLVIQK